MCEDLGELAFSQAIDTIRAIYSKRSADIAAGSVLSYCLDEAAKFVGRQRDLLLPTGFAEQDELDQRVGLPLHTVYRVAKSLDGLDAADVPKLAEKMRDLARFRSGDQEQESQFREAEYELLCAMEFLTADGRPAFIVNDKKDRYQKNVEFLIRHKWPVECKRPRVRNRVVANIRAAIEKIAEREQPGVVCLSLDEALSLDPAERVVLDVESACEVANAKLRALWEVIGNDALDALAGTLVVGVLFHQTVLVKTCDDTVNMPVFRAVATPQGTWYAAGAREWLLHQLDA